MNSFIEGQKTYLIPDDKRELYFNFVDKFKTKVKNVTDDNWNSYRDPLVTIDTSSFSFHQNLGIKLFMSRIGANEVN